MDVLALQQAKADAKKRYASQPPGAYVPPGWGPFYRAALASAGSALCRIAVIGDSLAAGFDTSDPLTKSAVGMLRIALQAASGDGGSGFKSVAMSTPFLTFKGLTAFITAWSSRLMTNSGFATVALGFGPGGCSLQSNSAADWIQDTVRGRYVKIGYHDSNVNWTYSIDGAAAVTVTAGSTHLPKVLTVDTGTVGTHTVKVTATGHTGTGNSSVTISGFAGENATGVVVNEFSVYGSKLADIIGVTLGTPGTGAASGGWLYPADLVILQRGRNDWGAGTAADTTVNYAQNILKQILDSTYGGTATGTTDVLLWQFPTAEDSYVAASAWWQHQGRFRALAEAYGLGHLNQQPLARASLNYWTAYLGSNTTPGANGTDAPHLSDAGELLVYNDLVAKVPQLLGTF